MVGHTAASKRDHACIWFAHLPKEIAERLAQLDANEPIELFIDGHSTIWRRMRPGNGIPTPGIRISSGRELWNNMSFGQSFTLALDDSAAPLVSQVGANGTLDHLWDLLQSGLDADPWMSFDALRTEENAVPFCAPPDLAEGRIPPKREDFTEMVRPMTFLERLLSMSGRWSRELAGAEERFAEARTAFDAAENERAERVSEARARHEAAEQERLSDIRRHNAEVNELEMRFEAGEPGAVEEYCSLVLQRSRYPADFPHTFRLEYIPEPRLLMIDYELPGPDLMLRAYEDKAPGWQIRRAPQITKRYQDVIASVALRTIYEVLGADYPSHLASVVFNGFVRAADPIAGGPVEPCMIALRVTKEDFAKIDLANVDKMACLEGIGARLSPRPAELLPVARLTERDGHDAEPAGSSSRTTTFRNPESFQDWLRRQPLSSAASNGGVPSAAPFGGFRATERSDLRKAECPSCRGALKRVPEAKTRCPHCAELMFVRTRPEDHARVVVTRSEAEQIEKDYEILCWAGEPDFRYITTEAEVQGERMALSASFRAKGYGVPSDHDVKWAILTRKAVGYARAGDLSASRRMYLTMAGFLVRRWRLTGALGLLLFVSIFDVYGGRGIEAHEDGSEPGPDDVLPSDLILAHLAPEIAWEANRIAKRLRLGGEELRDMIAKEIYAYEMASNPLESRANPDLRCI